MDIENDLPLTEATFLILLSLASGAKHGYAIMKEVEALSRGRISFSTGTLYGALKRLLEQGWIERSGEESADETARARKEYTLTMTGKRVLSAEVGRLNAMVQAARAYLPPELRPGELA